MFNILPLILIILCFIIILAVVIRKFSVLANLDVANMPAEKEAKFKEKIIGNRIKRGLFRYTSKISKVSKPAFGALGGFLKTQYDKLVEIKETPPEEREDDASVDVVLKMYVEAEDLFKQEKYDEAEKKLIALIGKDPKNIKAFRLLGEVYYSRKDYNESNQTLQHAQKLLEREYEDMNKKKTVDETKKTEAKNQLGSIYFDLSAANKAMENMKEALGFANKALDLEPNNPRFLDIKLEISIINKDKALAEITFDKLKAANPDNQKLKELRQVINEL